jgi:hypothetical protein
MGLLACPRPEKPDVAAYLAQNRAGVAAAAGEEGSGAARSRIRLAPEEEALPVAEYRGGALTLGDVRRAVEELGEFDRLRYQAADRKQEFLEALVDLELVALDAVQQGYDKDPRVQARLREELVRQYLDDQVAGKASLKDVREADVAAYYQANPAEFTTPEARRLAHLPLQTVELARQVRQETDLALAAVDSEDPGVALARAFKDAVERYEEDGVARQTGGEVGWVEADGTVHGAVQQPRLCAAEAQAAFQVEVGALVGPVACDVAGDAPVVGEGDGQARQRYVLALVEEVRPAALQPLAEVSPRIRNLLLQARIAELKRAVVERIVRGQEEQ